MLTGVLAAGDAVAANAGLASISFAVDDHETASLSGTVPSISLLAELPGQYCKNGGGALWLTWVVKLIVLRFVESEAYLRKMRMRGFCGGGVGLWRAVNVRHSNFPHLVALTVPPNANHAR